MSTLAAVAPWAVLTAMALCAPWALARGTRGGPAEPPGENPQREEQTAWPE